MNPHSDSSAPQARSLSTWIIATRPWSFPASAAPVLVTTAWLAQRGEAYYLSLALLTLLSIVLFHAAGNTWSDYFDFRQRVDQPDTFGAKTLTDGVFRPREILGLSLGLLATGLAIGLLLAVLTGWALVLVGAAGLALTLLYPPLKYRALGDVVIFLTYAVLPMMGTALVVLSDHGGSQLGTQLATAADAMWPNALPVGLITVAILHANNVRDIATDRRAHISTLAMRVGERWSIFFYDAEVLLPFAWVAGGVATGLYGWPVLATLLLLPLALRNVRTMHRLRTQGAAAIAMLDQATAQLLLAFALLLSASLAVCALLSV